MVLRTIRPEDLPVPEEASDGLAVEDEKKVGETPDREPVVDRQSRVPSRERSREMFKTPESWSAGRRMELEGRVQQGALPPVGRKAVLEAGVQSQGPLPPEQEAEKTEGLEPGWSRAMDDEALQRALEKEVVAQLHQENTELKKALAELQEAKMNAGSSTSSWSDVTGASGVQPPPPPCDQMSPRFSGGRKDEDENRFTQEGHKFLLDLHHQMNQWWRCRLGRYLACTMRRMSDVCHAQTLWECLELSRYGMK